MLQRRRALAGLSDLFVVVVMLYAVVRYIEQVPGTVYNVLVVCAAAHHFVLSIMNCTGRSS